MWFSISPGAWCLPTGSILQLAMEKIGTTNAVELAHQKNPPPNKKTKNEGKCHWQEPEETTSHDLPYLDLDKFCYS